MGSMGTMAAAPLAADPKFQYVLYSLILVGALLAGAVAIALLQRWRKRPSTEGLSAGDQLTHFRRLYEAGELSREEFEQIRSQLAGKLKQELNLAAPVANNPPPPAPKSNGDGFRPKDGPPPNDGIRPADPP
jgi:hypothetical protein